MKATLLLLLQLTAICFGQDFTPLSSTTTIPKGGLIVRWQWLNTNIRLLPNEKLSVSKTRTSRAAEFVLTASTDGTEWYFQNRITQLYVSAEEAGKKSLRAVRPAARSWETFLPSFLQDGSVSLVSKANGKFVSLQQPHNTLIANSETAVGSFFDYAPRNFTISTPSNTAQATSCGMTPNTPARTDDSGVSWQYANIAIFFLDAQNHLHMYGSTGPLNSSFVRQSAFGVASFAITFQTGAPASVNCQIGSGNAFTCSSGQNNILSACCDLRLSDLFSASYFCGLSRSNPPFVATYV